MKNRDTIYRVKSRNRSGRYLTHTYGASIGEPLESTTLTELAYIVAYLYHRQPVSLYESKDGRHFVKSDEKAQTEFGRILGREFTDRERH